MMRQQRSPLRYPRAQQTYNNVQGSKIDRFSGSLDTFQQVLGVIQSTAPYVEKYGPMIQKLPTMYRIYRAVKNIDDSVDTEISKSEPSIEHEEHDTSTQSMNQIGSYPLPTLFI